MRRTTWNTVVAAALLVPSIGCLRSGFGSWDASWYDARWPADAGSAERASADAAPVDGPAADHGADAAGLADRAADAGLRPDASLADGRGDTAAAGDASVADRALPLTPVLVGSAEIGGAVNEIVVAGDLAYLATGSAGQSVQIWNVADPAAPLRIGSSDVLTAAQGIAIVGDLVYVVGDGSPSNLHILDVSNPAVPSERGHAATDDVALAIKVSGTLAHVVSMAGGDDYEVFDVGDPAYPTKLGGLDLLASYYVRGVDARGSIAYVAGQRFNTIDVSDPTAPVILGDAGFFWYATDLRLTWPYAVGLESNNGNGAQLRIWDVADPSAPVSLSATDTSDNYARSLFVQWPLLHVVIDDGYAGLYDLFDATDPTAPRLVGHTTLHAPGQAVCRVGGHLLIGLVDNGGTELEIYDLR